MLARVAILGSLLATLATASTGHEDKKVQFMMPVGHFIMLLKCGKMQLFGRAMDSGASHEHQQWFDGIRIHYDEKEEIKVTVAHGHKNESTNGTEVKAPKDQLAGDKAAHKPHEMLDVIVEGNPLKETGSLATDNAIVSTWTEKKGEAVQYSVDGFDGSIIQIRSALAHNFPTEEQRRKYTHLDLSFLQLNQSECTAGVLAEIWGLTSMSEDTAGMLLPEPNANSTVADLAEEVGSGDATANGTNATTAANATQPENATAIVAAALAAARANDPTLVIQPAIVTPKTGMPVPASPEPNTDLPTSEPTELPKAADAHSDVSQPKVFSPKDELKEELKEKEEMKEKEMLSGDLLVDQLVDPSGSKLRVRLPHDQETQLIKCEDLEIYGQTFVTGEGADEQTWFNKLRIAMLEDGSEEKDVLTVAVAQNATNGSFYSQIHNNQREFLHNVSVHVDDVQVDRKGAIATQNSCLVSIWSEHGDESVQFACGDTILQIKAAHAQKLAYKETRKDEKPATHLDLRFIEITTTECSGILTEIWGHKAMSQSTADKLAPTQ